MYDVEITNAKISGHFFFTNDFHTEHLISSTYLFSHTPNKIKYARALYSLFKNLPITAVITPNSRGGNLLASDIAGRYGPKVRALLARREEHNIFITELPITPEDKVLVIDDGLNTGNSLTGLLQKLNKIGCEVLGIGILINRYIHDLNEHFGNYGLKYLYEWKEYPIMQGGLKTCNLCRRLNFVNKELVMAHSKNMLMTKIELTREKAYLSLKPAYEQ